MKQILLIILMLPLLLSTDTMSIRGQILSSIENKKHSLYVNHIYDDALALADAYDIQSSILIAQACIFTRYGKKEISLSFVAYQIATCSLCSNTGSKNIINIITKYKLFLLDKFA